MGGAQSFAREARRRWPEFARDVERASGMTCLYREAGALVIAHDDAGARSLRAEAGRLRAIGAEAVPLDASQVRDHEPALAPHIAAGLFVSGDADVDNRLLGEALVMAFRRAGGTLRERSRVQSPIVENGRAAGVTTAEGPAHADAVVVAAGAWSGTLPGSPPEAIPPVRPAKGQLIALAPPPGARFPKRIIGDHRVYLVPRGERVLVGATVEDAGFDTSVTAGARAQLVASAARIVPAAGRWPVVEAWAGLRPRSPDDAPVLGETGLPGLFVASGQFRNGILFAPAVAEALACLVTGRRCAFEVNAFDPRRFGLA
jgi:glycine oxidase